ncbi:midasin-like [Bolinopsis microptera]|uniref:midasin-like n=1 Tax=Bolinopsis microptera TaxID=2820187 RepID=UPI003078EBFB
MLGAISSDKKSTNINVRSIYNNFISSLNDDLLLHLPKDEGLKELNNAEKIVDYLYTCWLVPEICYHVASTCRSLCKVFVVRGSEDQTKHVEYVHALGKTAAHTNISVECYNFMISKVGILKDDLSSKDTLNILSGITSIVKSVPQCKDLICKEDLLRLRKSGDAEISRSAEHLLTLCNGLNDDVFGTSTPVDYPGDLWKEDGTGDAVMDDSEPVYLERLSHSIFDTCGGTLHIKQKKGTVKELVRTSNVEEAIAHIGEAYDARKPVLLQGQIGSGKTCVLEHFASLFGLSQEDVLSVQLDEQTDSKILIGNYVCSEVPGQYVWQPGIITRAASTGKWIIFEDIDHAPSDIIALIKSVTETRRIQTPVVELPTHPNFTIFLTQRVTDNGFSYKHNPVLAMLDNTFIQVRLKFYDDIQLKQVISGKFPALAGCSERLVHLYNSLSNSTLRQLMKWSSRVQGHLTHNLTVVTKEVFLEAVDCFCSWQSCPQKRTETAYKIGTFLSMPKSKVESYLTSYQPVVTASRTHYTVGRCTLQCGGTPHPTPLFAHTRHTVVLLEKLACAVLHCEPVLLTGETGNGKTASVQHLAARTGNNLVVINMSQQSDAADLIGGFKPLDVVQLMKPLYTTFELLFKDSFSVTKNANFLQKVQVCVCDVIYWIKKINELPEEETRVCLASHLTSGS